MTKEINQGWNVAEEWRVPTRFIFHAGVVLDSMHDMDELLFIVVQGYRCCWFSVVWCLWLV